MSFVITPDRVIKAIDPATGDRVELTAVQDTNGDWVLRTVDAAPFAYDTTNDANKTILKKSLPQIQTLSETVNVEASGNKTFTIQPPQGEVWNIKHLAVDIPVPSGGGSGTHVFDGHYSATNSSLNQIFTISNTFSAKIVIRGNAPLTKNNCFPTAEGDFANALRNISCSYDNPLILLYTNLTNVAQTGTIGLKIVKEIEYVV